MIQFNLLPDVKLQYIRAKSLKRTIVVISVLVSATALTVFILMFLTVSVLQKKHLRDLNRDIQTDSQTLQKTPDLNKVLTVQNQLNSLTALHDAKPVTSRLFTYVSQLTPNQVSIGKLELNYGTKSITFTGTADSISTINKFIDTLKFTTYAYPDSNGAQQTGNAFSNVVLSNFGKTDTNASYQIAVNFNSVIFDSSKSTTLTVPNITSTRSETEQPTDLFQALPDTTKAKGAN